MAVDAPGAAPSFGSCCGELKDAMSGEEFEPLLTVGDDGVLYMSVGLIDLEHVSLRQSVLRAAIEHDDVVLADTRESVEHRHDAAFDRLGRRARIEVERRVDFHGEEAVTCRRFAP